MAPVTVDVPAAGAATEPIPAAATPSPPPARWTGLRDVGEAAAEAARAAPTNDAAELLHRLDLQVRAGHDADAVLAMDALRGAEPPPDRWAVAEFGGTLIHTHRDDLALRLIERFPATDVPWTPVLLARRARADGWQTVDRWAAARAPADPTRWLRERIVLRHEFGAAAELLDEIATAARARPADTDGFIAWIDAAARVELRPDVSWVADAARPALAFDATRLGERLLAARAPRAAAQVLERSLAMPVTDADAAAMRAWFLKHHAAWETRESVAQFEPILRRSTRFQLADALLAAGEAARAQTVLEALAADAKTTGELPDLFLAGRIQAGSGARVIEKRVVEAEEKEADTAEYWRRRAEYFRGRGEKERQREAQVRLLAVVERDLASLTWETGRENQRARRYFLVGERARLVGVLSGKRAAFDVLHAEIAAMPQTIEEAGFLVGFLADDYREFLDADDPALWRFLEARPAWEIREEKLLWRLAETRKGAARDAVWSRAEALAAAGPPERSYVLGWVMTRTDAHARAVPLLRAAVAGLVDTNLRGQAAYTLIEACEATRDWRTAESAWSEILSIHARAPSGLTSREIPEWAAKPARIAARAGAEGDAMRLWAAKVNLDRGEFSGLRDLRDAGLGDRLRESYSALGARDPAAAPAVARALAALAE